MAVTHRRAIVIGATCVVWLGLLAAGCGSGTANQTNGVATGSVTCVGLSGEATFSPSLTLSGSAPEHITITLHSENCTSAGSNVGRVTSASAVATNNSGTSGCTSLLSSKPVEVKVNWVPSTIHASVVSFSGYAPTAGGSGSGLVFPEVGGKARVTGSFAGSNGGASSTATAFIGQNEVELLSACENPTGISSLAITSGHVSLG